MSELRAPDPTLTALDYGLDVAMVYDGPPPNVAHRLVPHPDDSHALAALCDPDEEGACLDGWLPIAAQDAAYVAVPCRECFPGAPPPGYRRTGPDERLMRPNTEYAEANLSWQVVQP